MFLSRLGPLQYTDDWVPCGQYTDVPIFEAVSSGSPTVHRRLGPGLPYSKYTEVPISEAVSSGSTTVHRRLGSPTVNTQMFLFLRQSRLGLLQYTDVWVLYSTQTTGSRAPPQQIHRCSYF